MDELIEFIDSSTGFLEDIYTKLLNTGSLNIKTLDPDKTVLVVVDMVNGFAREGALKSERVEKLIPQIEKLSCSCDEYGISKIAFYDCHSNESVEFGSYPPHCLNGTHESELVDELKKIGSFTMISKNSTNGFLEKKFQSWLEENAQIENYIVVGDCTDICILQFALSIKAYGNMKNKNLNIIIPQDCVDTFDAPMHNAEFMSKASLYIMMSNGIQIIKNIEV